MDAVWTIQKHCKDHIAESTAKHVTNRYHPYANTTIDVDQHMSDSNNMAMINIMDMNMDLDGILLHVAFTERY